MSVRSIRSPWIAGVLAAAIALPNGALLRAQTAQTAKPPATTTTQSPATTTAKPPATSTAKPPATTTTQSPATTTAKPPATTTTAKPASTAKPATPPPGTNADIGWPRTVVFKTGKATWYQPQIESWTNQKQMVAWSAVSFTPNGTTKPALGTIKMEADTQVAVDDRVVRLDMKIVEYNFPSLSTDQVKA